MTKPRCNIIFVQKFPTHVQLLEKNFHNRNIANSGSIINIWFASSTWSSNIFVLNVEIWDLSQSEDFLCFVGKRLFLTGINQKSWITARITSMTLLAFPHHLVCQLSFHWQQIYTKIDALFQLFWLWKMCEWGAGWVKCCFGEKGWPRKYLRFASNSECLWDHSNRSSFEWPGLKERNVNRQTHLQHVCVEVKL